MSNLNFILITFTFKIFQWIKIEFYIKIPLNQYIIGFKGEVEGHHILPTFGERRLGCGRSCLKGGRCRLCDAYIQLSSTLKENDLVLVNEEMDAIKSKSEFINIDWFPKWFLLTIFFIY